MLIVVVFAGAVRPEQGEDLSARDGEVQVVDDDPAPEGLAETLHCDGCVHRSVLSV